MKKFLNIIILFITFISLSANEEDVNNDKILDFQAYKIEILVNKYELNFYGINENADKSLLNSYKVATPKKAEPYPKEIGKVLKVELDPWWYPTQRSIYFFKKEKNINLGKAIPPGNPQNYMGKFKIMLSNSTKEKGNIYRIHGTIDESAIGKRSTGGCIRMYNNEGKDFAILVKELLKQGKQISVLYI